MDIVDEGWAKETLSDDEVDVAEHEAAVAPLMEEGELDSDAIVVSPTGNSSSTANSGTLVVILIVMLIVMVVVCINMSYFVFFS